MNNQNTPNNNHLTIFCDGGSRGNPGPAASAFLIYLGTKLLHESGIYLGRATNNHAEYTAVISALEWITTHNQSIINSSGIQFYLDSLLVVNQIKGLYRIKDKNLLYQNMQIQSLMQKLSGQLQIEVSFFHIPREKNSRADYLVNQTLDLQKNNS